MNESISKQIKINMRSISSIFQLHNYPISSKYRQIQTTTRVNQQAPPIVKEKEKNPSFCRLMIFQIWRRWTNFKSSENRGILQFVAVTLTFAGIAKPGSKASK